MANSDYEKRGTGTICPSATLTLSIEPGAETLTIGSFTAATSVAPSVGQGVMVDGEIMRVTSVSMPVIGVARGCADTIPAKHAFGTKCWFFTDNTGADQREYMATETIGVKVLMRSNSATMDLVNAPPNGLTFNRRFARPYPPGNVKVNDAPFWSFIQFGIDNPTLELTWAHRDRITQADTLQGHEVGDIGPEIGTTYTIQVRKPDGTVVRTEGGITTNTWSYSIADAIADLDFDSSSTETTDGYITLESERDGFVSWQKYTIPFDVNESGYYGVLYGTSWGSNA